MTAVDLDTGNNARITYRIVGGGGSSSSSHTSFNTSSSTSSSLASSIGGAGRVVARSAAAATASTSIAATAASAAASSSSSSLAASAHGVGDENAGELFGILPNSGWLYLRAPLDRESRDRYDITVEASDNGTPACSATAHIIVSVLDANDNDPAFGRDAYQFAVEENLRRGAHVGQVHASDADADENAAVRFALLPSNTSFQINAVTGEFVWSFLYFFLFLWCKMLKTKLNI